MADESSPNRIRLYERLRDSRIVNAGKRLVPGPVKRAVKWVLTRGQVAVEDLGGGATFTHPLGDKYWGNHEGKIRAYEPEIWAIVDRFVDKDTVFIDCGANMGLWSCAAAAKIGNKEQVIAVEPNDELLPWLQINRAGNGENFTVLPVAVAEKSAKDHAFHVNQKHSSSSSKIDPLSKPKRTISVPAVSIDDIIADIAQKTPKTEDIIVKLDVEGAEREALAGAANAIKDQSILFMYEDHGKEPSSETTQHFLAQGLNVYYIGEDLKVRRIHRTDELKEIKTNPVKGYNFFACRPDSGFDDKFSEACQHGLSPLPSSPPVEREIEREPVHIGRKHLSIAERIQQRQQGQQLGFGRG